MDQRVVMEGVLTNDQGEVLIVQRSDHESFAGQYELPSGKVEIGEDPLDALAREYEEETGLDVVPVKPLQVDHYETGDRHNVAITYQVSSENFDGITLSDEHQDYAWTDRDGLETYDVIGPVEEELREIWDDL